MVDVNFPAVEAAVGRLRSEIVKMSSLHALTSDCADLWWQACTTTGELVQLAGVDAPAALDAIGSVLPIDYFVDEPMRVMCPSEGLELPPSGQEVLGEASSAMAKHTTVEFKPLERYAFYEAARSAFGVVQCSERRPYACYLLQKGVVGPDGKDLMP